MEDYQQTLKMVKDQITNWTKVEPVQSQEDELKDLRNKAIKVVASRTQELNQHKEKDEEKTRSPSSQRYRDWCRESHRRVLDAWGLIVGEFAWLHYYPKG